MQKDRGRGTLGGNFIYPELASSWYLNFKESLQKYFSTKGKGKVPGYPTWGGIQMFTKLRGDAVTTTVSHICSYTHLLKKLLPQGF